MSWRWAWRIAGMDLKRWLTGRESWLWLLWLPLAFTAFFGWSTAGQGDPARLAKPTWHYLHGARKLQPFDENLQQLMRERGFVVLQQEDRRAGSPGVHRLQVPDFEALVSQGESNWCWQVELAPLPKAWQQTLLRDLNSVLASFERHWRADLAARQRGDSATEFPELDGILGPSSLGTGGSDGPSAVSSPVPGGFAQAGPGMLIMFTLLSCAQLGGVFLFMDRQQGRLRRLAAAPHRRFWVMLGKWQALTVLACFQIVLAIMAAYLLFGWLSKPFPLALIVPLGLWAAFCAGVGLSLANLASSLSLFSAYGMASGLILAALGGCWWPIQKAPLWLQWIGRGMPTQWTLNLIQSSIREDWNWSQQTTPLAALAMASGLSFWLALKSFRFE
ncbi:MAG: ABC transporter permease [Planctomycetota bacterium]|nr:MAG: ABC transporter permease [Planctomycetota bacterium]